MSKHADLTTMVCFVGQHVGDHGEAARPGLGPGVTTEWPAATRAWDGQFYNHL